MQFPALLIEAGDLVKIIIAIPPLPIAGELPIDVQGRFVVAVVEAEGDEFVALVTVEIAFLAVGNEKVVGLIQVTFRVEKTQIALEGRGVFALVEEFPQSLLVSFG